MATLTEIIRQQVLARLRGETVPNDPLIGFTNLPLTVGVLASLAASCDECGALVLRSRETTHTDWHRSLVRMVVDPPPPVRPPPEPNASRVTGQEPGTGPGPDGVVEPE